MDGRAEAFQSENTLTVPELLKAWTIGGQKNLGMEEVLGTLEEGKLADIKADTGGKAGYHTGGTAPPCGH